MPEAKCYVTSRKGIPYKIITGGDEVASLSTELKRDFVPQQEIASKTTRTKLVRSAKNLEETFRSAFNKLDLNINGYITADELVHASADLGHQLQGEEAKVIANALSEDGNIPFSKFKYWWVIGRADFNTFRNIVKMELSMNKLVK